MPLICNHTGQDDWNHSIGRAPGFGATGPEIGHHRGVGGGFLITLPGGFLFHRTACPMQNVSFDNCNEIDGVRGVLRSGPTLHWKASPGLRRMPTARSRTASGPCTKVGSNPSSSVAAERDQRLAHHSTRLRLWLPLCLALQTCP